MSLDYLLDFLLTTVRMSAPLGFAALGGLVSERSGMIQLGLEGQMLAGALAGATLAYFSNSAEVGFIGGAAAGVLIALLYAILTLHFKTSQLVTGFILNLAVIGISPQVTSILFQTTGSTPSLPLEIRFQSAPLWILLVVSIFLLALYYKSTWGLYLKFAGENPNCLQESGVSSIRVKWMSLALCGGLAGMGGATLSLMMASSYSPMMTAGRGFIAITAVILGRWSPLGALLACLFFGFIDTIQMMIQGQQNTIPSQFIATFPYLITLIVLVTRKNRILAPAALGNNN